VPGPSNGNNGQNFDFIANPTLDKPWLDADSNLDQNARIQDAIQGQKVLSDIVPALPLDPFPDIVIVNSNKIASDTGKFRHNFAFGPFIYANDWFLK
jgi:ABC-type transport system substrate-binding protein